MAGAIAIVGGGLAGASCALELRAQGFGGALHLFSAEAYLPYERPPLSKGVLSGDPITYVGGAGGIAGADIVAHGAAVGLDTVPRLIEDSHGETTRYDTLLIATGRRARRLAILESLQCPVFTLRTHDDACWLREISRTDGHVLIIGAGLIGMEVAAHLVACSASVTLVEAGPQVMARAVPAPIAQIAAKALVAKGVDLRTNTHVDRAEPAGVVLSDGQKISSDLVVCAVGSVPDDDLARRAGLAVDNGVVVDAHLRTSVAGVFAAGDVVAMQTPAGIRRFENYQAAQMQGRMAARNMLGSDEVWRQPDWFWSEQGDLRLEGVGIPVGEAMQTSTLSDGSTLVQVERDGMVLGAFGVGGRKALREVRRAQRHMSAPSSAVSVDPVAIKEMAS